MADTYTSDEKKIARLSEAHWVCADCGWEFGNTEARSGSTWHMGKCDICLTERAVTEFRDFGYSRITGGG